MLYLGLVLGITSSIKAKIHEIPNQWEKGKIQTLSSALDWTTRFPSTYTVH